jgi:hypothetical protein
LFAKSRNGTSPKTVSSEVGDVELAMPRDRNGTFSPQLTPKGSRRLGGLDGVIISLYAGGMTLRDIQHHLVSTIGTELSHETLSKIRRTGLGVHNADRRCTQQASSVFVPAHNAVLPSMPAVFRPALISATRRTLSKAFARDRNINLCKLRTLFRSPSLDAVKIRCRKRRTSSSTRSQSTWSQSGRLSSGPVTTTFAAASNFQHHSHRHLHRLTRPASAPFQAEASAPYPAS